MTFLYLNSNKMGKGDEKLGEILMESFLEKLSNSDAKIDFIGGVNSGVLLTTKGSPVIDILKKIEKEGAKIFSCGTCLDYYKLRDILLVGEVGTMEQSVEIMSKADKIITP